MNRSPDCSIRDDGMNPRSGGELQYIDYNFILESFDLIDYKELLPFNTSWIIEKLLIIK